ncbi:MAG TPA: phage tail tube protein [Rubrivivax sp.]|nr:phage tail tube protein [Rubrivivax sp.]
MSRKIVNGTIFEVGTTYGSAITISAATNAAQCVLTLSAAHGVTVGDVIEIVTSGWGALIGRAFRAVAVATNDVTIAIDTSSTASFPAGQGAGTARKVTAWAQIQQVNSPSVSGGEQNFGTGQYIDQSVGFEYPTNKSPIKVTFEVDDDQSLTYWTTLKAAQANLANYALRMTYPGSGGAVGTGIWTYSAAPALESNNVQKRTINVSLANVFTEY